MENLPLSFNIFQKQICKFLFPTSSTKSKNQCNIEIKIVNVWRWYKCLTFVNKFFVSLVSCKNFITSCLGKLFDFLGLYFSAFIFRKASSKLLKFAFSSIDIIAHNIKYVINPNTSFLCTTHQSICSLFRISVSIFLARVMKLHLLLLLCLVCENCYKFLKIHNQSNKNWTHVLTKLVSCQSTEQIKSTLLN